jgi:CRISPR system Cascade subunit CasB
METEEKKKTSKGAAFASFVIERMKQDTGFGARLRRADNPATEYQAWEILAKWCDIEKSWERIPVATIGAALAKSKPEHEGHLSLGKAIAASYEKGNQDDAAKAKLRRLLACGNVEEACAVLRSLLRLINSRGKQLNHGQLLDQLLFFGEKTRLRWASDFYGKRGDDDSLSV